MNTKTHSALSTQHSRPRIAIDVMGGDHAPSAVLDAARRVREESEIDLLLVGNSEVVRPSGFEHVATTERVTMEDKPARIFRDKPDSSMKVALELVRDGKADAAVSAGSTGAFMALAVFVLGRIPGIDRPALGGFFPTAHGRTFLIDAGANADVKPQFLLQFALMGSVYLQRIFAVPRPKVGLLNIGGEEGKGNHLAQQTFPLLKASSLNFIGNVEGNDIPEGKADVVVCDGFTGNIVAKLSEGVASMLAGWIREEIYRDWYAPAGALLLKPAFRRLRKRFDHSEYGAAPLFGVNGLAVKTHGRSSARGIQSAINLAALAVRQELIAYITAALSETASENDEGGPGPQLEDAAAETG